MSRKALFLLIALPFLGLIITFLFLKKPIIHFFSPDYKFQVFSDKVTGLGQSEISARHLNNAVYVNYTLKDGDPYPFVSMVFRSENFESFDSKGYILNLELESNTDHELIVRVGFVLKGYTQKENLDSYLFVEKTLPIVKGKNRFQLPLDQITQTPGWWFISKKFTRHNLPEYSRDQTGYIALYDVPHPQTNQSRNLQLTEFEIHPTYYNFYKYSAIAVFIYGIVIFFVFQFRTPKNTKENRVLVPIDLSLKENKEKNHIDLITIYLAENFSNPELKLEEVAKEIGLNEKQISIEIKNYSGKSFKSYLNFLRIEKAKKLLRESDLQVSEIAYEVGYNSAHHFIRVFKELEECSPTLFRNEYSNKDLS